MRWWQFFTAKRRRRQHDLAHTHTTHAHTLRESDKSKCNFNESIPLVHFSESINKAHSWEQVEATVLRASERARTNTFAIAIDKSAEPNLWLKSSSNTLLDWRKSIAAECELLEYAVYARVSSISRNNVAGILAALRCTHNIDIAWIAHILCAVLFFKSLPFCIIIIIRHILWLSILERIKFKLSRRHLWCIYNVWCFGSNSTEFRRSSGKTSIYQFAPTAISLAYELAGEKSVE